MGSPCYSSAGKLKKRYCREAAAAFVASYWTQVHGEWRTYYHCPECNEWHVTKKPQDAYIHSQLVDNETDAAVVSPGVDRGGRPTEGVAK